MSTTTRRTPSRVMPAIVRRTSLGIASVQRASSRIQAVSKQTLILVQHPDSPIPFDTKTLDLTSTRTPLGRAAPGQNPVPINMFKTDRREVENLHAEVWCKGKDVCRCYPTA